MQDYYFFKFLVGIPPGLKPYLELEAARLQLGAALFHHATIKCDRGCEGNDDDSDITSEGNSFDFTNFIKKIFCNILIFHDFWFIFIYNFNLLSRIFF